jgi:chemotaxis protein CheX
MPLEEIQVRRSVEELWTTVLGMGIEPLADPPRLPKLGLLTGCVQITGAWEGAVALNCGPRVAREAAAIMFGIPPGEANSGHIQDALGELTNILGGQLKGLLPGPSRLSLPAVVDGLEFAHHDGQDEVVARLGFTCLGDLVCVTVVAGAR